MSRQRKARWIRPLLWVVGVAAALLALLSLLAGPVAKGYINSHGEQLTGRRVHVERVGLNLFSGNVKVRGLEVYEDDGETPFAGFDTLDVSARLLMLPFKTLHIGHLTLAGLHAGVVQEGDRFNFSSLVEHFAPGDTSQRDTTPSGWLMKFYNIRLSHARLVYEDRLGGKGFILPDVSLRVPGFVLGGEESSEGGLNVGFDRGGHLNVDGSYDTRRNMYRLSARLEAFSLENIESYLSDLLHYDRLDGTVDAGLKAEGSTDDIMGSRIGGTLTVRGVDLRGGSGAVASFDSLKVDLAAISLDKRECDIAEVRLGGLKALYEQWKGYSNIGRLLPAKGGESVTLQTGVEEHVAESAAPSEGGGNDKPWQVKVGRLRVTDAAVTYDDHTLPDRFHFPMTGIGISADNLTTSGLNNAQLRASLPGGGHLVVRWNGDISEWKRHQDLFLTVKGLDMRQLSPWAVAYTGQPVEEGIFGLTTRLTVSHSELDNQNRIDIYKARVGSRRKDVEPEMKVSLKTALYVLKDKDGKILIDLPVSGNVDSPEFSYMKVVWKTLGNLLVKVATSPARALGNALGLGGEELEFMPVDAAQRSLTSEQYHTLSSLAAIAAADSLVGFTLEQIMPEAEGDSVAHRYEMLNRQVEAYLREQGVGETRFRIASAVAAPGQRTGYAISSELKMEE